MSGRSIKITTRGEIETMCRHQVCSSSSRYTLRLLRLFHGTSPISRLCFWRLRRCLWLLKAFLPPEEDILACSRCRSLATWISLCSICHSFHCFSRDYGQHSQLDEFLLGPDICYQLKNQSTTYTVLNNKNRSICKICRASSLASSALTTRFFTTWQRQSIASLARDLRSWHIWPCRGSPACIFSVNMIACLANFQIANRVQ